MKLQSKFFEFFNSQRGILTALLLCGAIGLLLLGFGGGETKERSVSLEEETAELCSSVAGVGDCSVMITYTEDERVYAVAVLCEGADSPEVRVKITSLASSLFGIGANRVSVLKLSK